MQKGGAPVAQWNRLFLARSNWIEYHKLWRRKKTPTRLITLPPIQPLRSSLYELGRGGRHPASEINSVMVIRCGPSVRTPVMLFVNTCSPVHLPGRIIVAYSRRMSGPVSVRQLLRLQGEVTHRRRAVSSGNPTEA